MTHAPIAYNDAYDAYDNYAYDNEARECWIFERAQCPPSAISGSSTALIFIDVIFLG